MTTNVRPLDLRDKANELISMVHVDLSNAYDVDVDVEEFEVSEVDVSTHFVNHI